MSNPIVEAAIQTGLIPRESLSEMKRWKSPIEIPDEVPDPPETIEEAAEKIRVVVESKGYILTKETDLEVLNQYLGSQKQGTLCVRLTEEEQDAQAVFAVIYGKTPLGEYIFPWQGDSLHDLMTNGATFLSVPVEDGTWNRIYFKDVREVFYGEVKAFMICTAGLIEFSKEAPNGID